MKRRPGRRAVNAVTVPEEDVLRLEPAEGAARRHEPEEGMHSEWLAPGAKVAHAPERVAAHEDSLLREVERDL